MGWLLLFGLVGGGIAVAHWATRPWLALDKYIREFDSDRQGAFVAPSVESILLNPAAAAMALRFKVIEVYVMSVPRFTNPSAGEFGGMDGSVVDCVEAFVLCTNGVVQQLRRQSGAPETEAAARALAEHLHVPFEHR